MVPVAEWALNQDYEVSLLVISLISITCDVDLLTYCLFVFSQQFLKSIKPLDFDIRGDVLLLFSVAAVTIVYFSTFDAPLRRTQSEEDACESEEECHLELEVDISSSTTVRSEEKMLL